LKKSASCPLLSVYLIQRQTEFCAPALQLKKPNLHKFGRHKSNSDAHVQPIKKIAQQPEK
jgi:hypothetical protein